MSRDKDPAGSRARRILERLTGSSEPLDESGARLDESRVAERLRQIEQLFLLHGGERDDGHGPDAADVLFEWGHLQVLSRLGEGSFGEVFSAYDRTLDREVALKLLKTDRDRPFQSQLFIHEARQLALVRHRNVLAVHGAAVHEGRPGLWTDLIDGHAAHDERYLESLGRLDSVLELVESLALALQAVHAAGLVHGDVKPSNIMRDASGEWILMDFGASLDQRCAQDGPAMTSGTPLYMAPEVVHGDPPAPESDLYALGATLYRVLTGNAPVAAEDWGALRAFHESGRAPHSADRSGLDRRIARLIDGLMERDPADRMRLGTVLERVGVIRQAPQRRFRKLALASIAGLLVLGMTLTSIGFYQANEARLEAEREQRKTAAVNEFLQRVLASPSTTGRAGDLSVEQMLLRAAAEVSPALADQPAARVVVHRVLAESFNTLRLSDRAREQIAVGREALANLPFPMPEIERGLTLQAARAAENEGRNEESLAILTGFADRHAAVLGDEDWQVRWARKMMVTNLLALSRFEQVEVILDEHFSEVPEPETAETHFGYEILQSRANLLNLQGRYEEAAIAAERAIDWLDRFPRERPNSRVNALTNKALSLTRAGRPAESIDALEALLPLHERMYGIGSGEYLGALINLGATQHDAGNLAAAGQTLTRALELIEAHPDAIPAEQQLAVSMNLANVLNATGEQGRGEAMIRESIGRAAELWSPEHVNVLKLEYNLAELLNQQERFEEAREHASTTLEKKRRALGETHVFTLLTMDNLAVALGGLGRGREAIDLQERALGELRSRLGPEHPFALLVERHRAASLKQYDLQRWRSMDVEDLVARHESALGPDHPDTKSARALVDE
ncbi:MAG: tetratricopeptide repeat protein [Gammaproteobacteria bacterium]|nr:tetratricopeptide repeat protein [Gammaproteobacteria bacterium]